MDGWMRAVLKCQITNKKNNELILINVFITPKCFFGLGEGVAKQASHLIKKSGLKPWAFLTNPLACLGFDERGVKQVDKT